MSKKKDKIILDALREYEENHWEGEGRAWQNTINSLIEEYEEKVNK